VIVAACARWLPVVLLAVSAVFAALGIRQALAGPVVSHVSVPIALLPPELEGLRIAQISDLHVGPMIRRGYVESVVRKVLDLKPDLIAVTGDLADGAPEALKAQIEPLTKLKAPLGVFYVTGNHEYYWGAQRWIDKAAELGLTPLLNENRVLSLRGAKILVAGVTDTYAEQFMPSHRSDPGKAAATGQNPAVKILLAHRPDSCLEAERAGFDLQLSGHTHGGQFFPFSLLIPLFHRYWRGLNRHGRLWVYVNRGTGYWGPPDRFTVPSEITLLQLTKDTFGHPAASQ
jgi:predicted MPP superfamily phosphohydrolase